MQPDVRAHGAHMGPTWEELSWRQKTRKVLARHLGNLILDGSPEPEVQEEMFREAIRVQEEALHQRPRIPTQDGHLAWVLARVGQYDTDPCLGLTEIILTTSFDLEEVLVEEMREKGWEKTGQHKWTDGELTVQFYRKEDHSFEWEHEAGAFYVIPQAQRHDRRALLSVAGVAYPEPVEAEIFETTWTLWEDGATAGQALLIAQELHA